MAKRASTYYVCLKTIQVSGFRAKPTLDLARDLALALNVTLDAKGIGGRELHAQVYRRGPRGGWHRVVQRVEPSRGTNRKQQR